MFIAEGLRPEDAAASYVLASLAEPGLTLAAWSRRLKARGRGAADYVAVRNPARCIVGLFRREGAAVTPIGVAQLPGIDPAALADVARGA